MSKLKVPFIALVTAALCAAALWYGTRAPKDPVSNGVKMSEWIDKANRDWSKNPIKPDDLRGMGSEAREFLEYSIRKNVPGENIALGERLPNSLRGHLPDSLYRRESYGSLKQCLFALEQLSNLGPEAQPAIPLLLEMLEHPNKSLRDAAGYGLNRIGPESWDEIEEVLRRTGSEARRSVLFTLTSRLSSPAPEPSDSEAARILDIFLDACADPDPEIQMLGVGGLLNCRAFYSHHFTHQKLPDRAGPVIADCVNRGAGSLKVAAVRALYYYPESIGLAAATMDTMAADSDSFYSDPARRTLQLIPKSRSQNEE